MDAGRRWALETFGQYGPLIREQIAKLVLDEHESSLDAQEASGHRSRSVYGEYWRGILEKFEEFFGNLPGAAMTRPGGAPYKIPVVNGVALYPWRYAKSRETELANTPFATSSARTEAANLRPTGVQEALLSLDLPDPQLTEEEQLLVDGFTAYTGDPLVSSSRMVLVAISSSVNGLFSVQWGEVQLTADGYVEWIGDPESLLELQPTLPVSTSPTRTFTSGEPPKRFPDTDVDGEASTDER
ncbi:hypothetical protein FB561_3208 [Kribbella amoyensis]|uniref:Uncharacterized protein n=1 Tax=Kribbella amoyensis TaxID=996641 RepID=A0A561BTE1_9ACTN|nr:hypothetical protein [Kribbella amoyensis]TWD82082.1 hypothetical protein FB561_3208 [Kribbella amoyensis]